MTTIEPEIQEKILEILPSNGELAVIVLAQLFANVVMSVYDEKPASIKAAIDLVMVNWNAYERNPI